MNEAITEQTSTTPAIKMINPQESSLVQQCINVLNRSSIFSHAFLPLELNHRLFDAKLKLLIQTITADPVANRARKKVDNQYRIEQDENNKNLFQIYQVEAVDYEHMCKSTLVSRLHYLLSLDFTKTGLKLKLANTRTNPATICSEQDTNKALHEIFTAYTVDNLNNIVPELITPTTNTDNSMVKKITSS